MTELDKNKININELDESSKILLEHFVEKSIHSLLIKYRWIFILIGILISVILFLIFIDYFKLKDVIADEKKNLEKVQSLKTELELNLGAIDLRVKALNEYESKIKELNNKQEALLNSNINYYNQRITDVNSKITSLENIQEKSKQLIDSGQVLHSRLFFQSQDLYEKGTMIEDKLIRFNSEIDTLNSIQEQFKIEFSSIYAFVERGKRKQSEKSKNGYDKYRPVIIQLPFSKEVLKVIFHRKEFNKKTGEKSAYLDFYLNDNTQYFISGTFQEGDVINIPDSRFKIVILQIYLSNPVFVHGYIPDFVTIKAIYK